ncbi:MAG: hypothetical protein ABIJ81_02130 [Patescibacteria group bacterium]
MKFNLKLLFISLVIFAILTPVVLLAQTKDEDINIITECWEQNECINTNGVWDDQSSKARKCGDKKGLCFAKNKPINLQVPIPGAGELTRSVTGFADYLTIFYKFFVAAIAVMAVVLIMWGGFKRIYAAGNAERIKDANETLFGALAGLVIALLSYSLLNLVNPKLVEFPELRIPKIKVQNISGNQCPVSINQKITECGKKFINPENGESCIGMICGLEQLISNNFGVCHQPSEAAAQMSCGNFIAQGKISWTTNAYVDYIHLMVMCKNGEKYVVYTPGNEKKIEEDVEEGSSYYKLGFIPKGESYETFLNGASYSTCETRGGLRGYYLLVQVNDDTSLLLPTDDDSFAVGKAGQNCLPISGADPDKIVWDNVSDNYFWQPKDFPLVSGKQSHKFCQSPVDFKNWLCDEDGDCGIGGKCSGIFTYNSCDLEINRRSYPAR